VIKNENTYLKLENENLKKQF